LAFASISSLTSWGRSPSCCRSCSSRRAPRPLPPTSRVPCSGGPTTESE